MSPINYLLFSYLLLVSTGQLVDEMQVYEDQCLGEDRFHCQDGGCVAREQQCDDVMDCADGSDELACLHQSSVTAICDEAHQFLCDDGSQCISTTWMCNNITECADGSDEINCTELGAMDFAVNATSPCKGFQCDIGLNTKCISTAWLCDAVFDCDDHTDEKPENCRHRHHTYGWQHCFSRRVIMSEAPFLCGDKSFCFPNSMVCDGMADCRDNSDEGEICENWKTMCNNITCGENATCWNTKEGPKCGCIDNYSTYNYTTKTCEFADMCEDPNPFCTQICYNMRLCRCDDGYSWDPYGIQFHCYAKEPEAKLFFSTMNDIRYLTVKSKQVVTVATGIKQAHGVSYDGTYLYWVETAKGHQSIVRAHLDNVQKTKEVLVSIGLEDAGDVAIDWMAGNIYFGDSERGSIYVCKNDGSMCKTLENTGAVHPKFVTLDPKNGMMYWADRRNHKAVIMMARMDGSQSAVLLDDLVDFPTGLAIDPPSGRLYYVAGIIVGVFIKNRKSYVVAAETIHHPYAIAVFENDVYFSDWTSHTIQRVKKKDTNLIMSLEDLVRYYKIDDMAYGMHIYHPVLMNRTSNPCKNHDCSHLCLIVSNATYRCACPDGFSLADNNSCIADPNFHPQYIVIAAGSKFTKIQVNTLGNAEFSATQFDIIGRVNAMAFDSNRDTLYIYDGLLKNLNFMFMDNFQTGLTHILSTFWFEDVVDMDFDPISDTLYILDAGSGYLEVFSVFTYKKAVLKRFTDETPISLCVLYNYGKILIALRREIDDRIEIREYDLDGEGGQVIVSTNLKGPRILMKYIEVEDLVYISDDGNSIIEYIHPKGTGRETYVELSTSVIGLALTPTYVFWTDRRNTRLYWSVLHEAKPRIRRLEFSIFPNNTHLHIQSTIPTPSANLVTNHACHKQKCSHVCVQSSSKETYKCLCSPGKINVDGFCMDAVKCGKDQGYCTWSDTCYSISGRCDGKQDCLHNEDEEGCPTLKPTLPTITPEIKLCLMNQKLCNGECVNKNMICKDSAIVTQPIQFTCDNVTEFECVSDKVCISRSQLCDGVNDCPDGSDEAKRLCIRHSCLDTEFRCHNGICIFKSFRCDGEPDCVDGSDEIGCMQIKCAAGYFTCKSGDCIPSRSRCDGTTQCNDESDELDCEDPDDFAGNQEIAENCKEWEYTCELNRTICIPLSARCNKKADCPGGTDEVGCAHLRSNCAWYCDWKCLGRNKVCDGYKHCPDGSDEFTDACNRVNRTSTIYSPLIGTDECTNGYLCRSGQCVDWSQVCDSHVDCYDESDEGGNCSTSCVNQCAHKCHASPSGPICRCHGGFKPDGADGRLCVDIDECQEMDVCAQGCYNIHGSYLCTCDRGYVLRPDRHSCKALNGNLTLFYASGNHVVTKAAWHVSVVYSANTTIQDIDINIRNNSLYVATENKLIEMSSSKDETVITNIGNPTKVTLDWSRGNVYFADQSEGMVAIRVCNFNKKRCAQILRLAANSTVPALTIDPSSYKLFYCVTTVTDSVIWAVLLSGQSPIDLASVNICSGLAVDTYRKKLYVAESTPPCILQMDYDGNNRKEMHSNDPHLKSPYGLSIFEDYIYYLVPESDQLRRCLLFGSKKCEVYQPKALQAREFELKHESLQRNDILDKCSKVVCDNICVNSDDGPTCVCEDGAVTRNGSCPLVEKIFLPQFNGEIHQVPFERAYTDAALACVLALLALVFVVLVTYFVVKKKETYSTRFTRVQFSWRHHGGSACDLSEEETRLPATPIIEVPENEPLAPNNSTLSEAQHEYLNPMERLSFIQHLRQSFSRHRRPVGTAGLTIDVPRSDDPFDMRGNSDTESDLDDRDTRSFSCVLDKNSKRNQSPQ